jgi:hypothetical protein
MLILSNVESAYLFEMRLCNTQDPHNFTAKPKPTHKSSKAPRSIMDQYKNNEFVKKFLGKAYDPTSPDTSDEEESEIIQKESPCDRLEREIEALFMSVKEECEKDRVRPEYESEEELEETPLLPTKISETPKANIPSADTAEVISRERIEQKGSVTFVIRSSGPSKYFKPQEKVKKSRKRRRSRKGGNRQILSLLSIAEASSISYSLPSFDYKNLTSILEMSKLYIGYSHERVKLAV